MKSTDYSGEAQEEFRLISDAIKAIAADNPGLLSSFFDAFRERSIYPELEESRGHAGLVAVLAELLWKYVPDGHFEERAKSSVIMQTEEVSKLLGALDEVSSKYSFVLEDFRRVRGDRRADTRSALEACLRFYVINKRVFPG